MCGITGIVSWNGSPPEEALLKSMTSTLHHRGPDNTGVSITDNVGLGHCRLAIIDISQSANQPMHDKNLRLVFNGEIYNFKELRKELVDKGYKFESESDTEVILRSWRAYGPDCVKKFRGMFAFVLHDTEQNKIYLVRDRLGKKPLYFHINEDKLLFASEIKALIVDSSVSRELCSQSLSDYITWGYPLQNRTVYKNVNKVPPASIIEFSTGNPESNTGVPLRYWQYQYKPDYGVSPEEWVDKLDSVLKESVRIRMISDVPLGAFLSGGVDSSLVVGVMSQIHSRPVETFNIGFDVKNYDESRKAKQVASYLGTSHHTKIVDPSALALIPDLITAYDEPFADESAIPTLILSQFARENVTVALTGDGGDEFFSGYSRYVKTEHLKNVARLSGASGRKIFGLLTKIMRSGQKGKLNLQRLNLNEFEQYASVMGYYPDRISLLNKDVIRQVTGLDKSGAGEAFYFVDSNDSIVRYQNWDIHNYLPEDILVKVDRASMHHSLEVRSPLLDHCFVDLSAQIPREYKTQGNQGKIILKNLAERYLPKDILERPKKGFSVPLQAWFKGELKALVEDMVADRSAPIWQYFDNNKASHLVKLQVKLGVNTAATLWRLLFFHKWSQQYL